MNTVKNTVKFENLEITLSQTPYVSDDGKTYQAHGCLVGEEAEVIVFWDVCEFVGDEPENQDEMCDWNTVARVMFL